MDKYKSILSHASESADIIRTQATSAAACCQFSFMRLWLLSLSLFLLILSALGTPETRGVHPSFLSKYKPEGSTWTCLDGSKTISWTAVNDDYCDCLDGSDEPGLFFPTIIPRELTRLARNECMSAQYVLLHERGSCRRKYPKFACE
jgi:hypothetical protein